MEARIRRRKLASVVAFIASSAALLFIAFAAYGRVGGGESYSGGGSGGSGGGDGSGGLAYIVFRLLLWLTIEHPVIGIPTDLVVIYVVYRRIQKASATPSNPHLLTLTTVSGGARSQPITALRRFDPNFSAITFADFCYSLYGRAQNARGEGKLDNYAPYLSDDARRTLSLRNPVGLREVRGVVIGSFTVDGLLGLDSPVVQVPVSFESNYTEVVDGGTQAWYVRERWILERKRDILSPPPGKAKADHCPRCGAALTTRTDGSCEYCGVRITDGSFQWYVRAISLLSKNERGPLLTSNVPEEGTSRLTILQPDLVTKRANFEAEHPDFKWDSFDARVRLVATTLQNAWSSRQWESVRPFESEGLFQMHRYWIEAYIAQHLRNVVDDYNIGQIDMVKIDSDAFYDAITVRLWATGRDHTDADDGRIVAGSKRMRSWSEYWTFIRGRTTGTGATRNCPNCGAPVAAGSTGICGSCGGKLTTSDFDWILSRIEQDEAYTGSA